MDLDGMIQTTCPVPHLLRVLQNPETMLRMLPEGSNVTQTDASHYKFAVRKSLGLLSLTLPGTLEMTPVGDGPNIDLIANAAHMLGGKVAIALRLKLTRTEGQTRLAYAGTVSASGLAATVLQKYPVQTQKALKAAFLRLKTRAESTLPAAAQPGQARAKGGPHRPGRA